MCDCMSSILGNGLSGSNVNNGLYGRYSNLTQDEATQKCLDIMDKTPTAYGGNLSQCVQEQKGESGKKALGYLDQVNNFLKNATSVLGVFTGPQQPDPSMPPPPSAPSSGIGVVGWIGIGLVVLVVGTLAYFIVKPGKNGK